jgi:hypothetical protein
VVKVVQVVVVVVVAVLSVLPAIAEAGHSAAPGTAPIAVSEAGGATVQAGTTSPGADKSVFPGDLPWRTIPPVAACVLLAALPSLRVRSLVVVVAFRR